MAEEAKNGSEGSVVASQGHGAELAGYGTAVVSPDAVENPGMPNHRETGHGSESEEGENRRARRFLALLPIDSR